MARTYAATLEHWDLHPGDRIVCRIGDEQRVCTFSSWGVTGRYDSAAVLLRGGKGKEEHLQIVQARDVVEVAL